MTYTTCAACGQKALRVANRCPRCGLAFEDQFFSRATTGRPPRRIPVALVLGGLLVLLVLGGEWIRQRSAPPAPQAAPVARPVVRVESVPPPAAVLVPEPPTDSSLPVARPPAVRVPPVPTASARQVPTRQHRVTRTWVNLRSMPSSAARIIGVLPPGEVVEVDTVVRGWFRVSSTRLSPGYVDPRLLNPLSPTP